jgi:serine/threonine-protein kinase HipA
MSDRLAIWLYDTKVATVEQERRRMSLQYTPEAIQTFPAGTPLLSLRLALRRERFPNGVVRSFLDGLLPEEDARRLIAQDLGLRADDTFALAGALGRDCAGALVIQKDNEQDRRASE